MVDTQQRCVVPSLIVHNLLCNIDSWILEGIKREKSLTICVTIYTICFRQGTASSGWLSFGLLRQGAVTNHLILLTPIFRDDKQNQTLSIPRSQKCSARYWIPICRVPVLQRNELPEARRQTHVDKSMLALWVKK